MIFTNFITHSTLNTDFLVDMMFLFWSSRYGIPRTVFITQVTSRTGFFNNREINQFFTDASSAFFIFNMFFIFISKIFERRNNWIWSGLTQSTQEKDFHFS